MVNCCANVIVVNIKIKPKMILFIVNVFKEIIYLKGYTAHCCIYYLRTIIRN